MNRPEQVFQRAVVQFLDAALRDCIWFHCPNGGGRSKAEAGILKSMGVRAGVADLVIINEFGRVHFIELKAGKGSLSPAQKAFRAECGRLSIPWSECRTLAEVEGTLAGWGFTPKARIAA